MKNIIFLGIVLNVFLGFSQTIALQSFAAGFSSPVDIANAGDTRLFVVEQGGLIKILNSDGTINATPFLNLTSLTAADGERGLLGLTFHPNYATNGLFFINYTNLSGNTVIARYGVSANANVANSTGTILMTISQPYNNHNGGCLKFGSDGYLYIGMGDGGSAGDPNGYSQNLTINASEPSRIYLGKMLRIDVNSTTGSLNYGFPPTNPYISQAGKEEIWARGLRNPWKFSFNRLNGDLWIADVGQGTVEEVDKIVNPLPAMNFGWRCYEGNSSYNTSGCFASNTMVFPFAQYTHSSGGCSITGGYFYTGTTYPNFQNKYFFTDYCDDKIRTVNSSGVITTTTSFSGNNFVTFGQDKNGELYLAGLTSGIIYKIIDSALSNSEFSSNGFSIYPNPAKSSFTIKSNPNNFATELELFDLTGKLLIHKKLNNIPENTITTNSLSKGIYLISITTTNGSNYNDKLIIE